MNIKLKIIGMGIALLAMSGASYAVAPANSTLTNTATLTYTGLSTPLTASVDVTVNLTPSSPVLSDPAAATAAENQNSTTVYTITSTANGSDAYNLTSAAPVLNNITGAPAVTFNQGGPSITSVTLGATAASTLQTAGNSVITVPSDGTADAAVNNIAGGDTVVINGTVYPVTSVSDNGTVGTITLGSPLAANINPGDLIAEQQSFNVLTTDVGAVTTTGSPATVTVGISAAAATPAVPALTPATDDTVITVVEVTFNKFVRNITNANGGAVGTTFGGNSYYATAGSVTAVKDDVLEYLIQVTAPAGTTLTGVRFADTLPPFTTYDPNSTMLNGSSTGAADSGGNSPLVGAGMLVNDSGSAVNSGTVAAGTTASVTVRVVVD